MLDSNAGDALHVNGIMAALALTAGAIGASSYATAPTIAQALAMPIAADLVGAPTGKRFAWIVNRGGVRNLWIGGAGPSHPLTAYAADDGMALSEPGISPDGAHVVYVRGGDPEFPEALPPNPLHLVLAPQALVHVVALDGTHDVVLGSGHAPAFSPDGHAVAFATGGDLLVADAAGKAPAHRLATIRGTIARIDWTPDGRSLLFVVDRGDHSLLALLDVARAGAAGAAVRFLDPGFGAALEPCFSPDGRTIAYIRAVAPPLGAVADSGSFWSIRAVDLATGAARTLWQAPPGKGGDFVATRHRNLFWIGETLVFPWECDGWLHVYALPTGGGDVRDLTPGAFEVEGFAADRTGVVYAANMGDPDRQHLWRVPIRGGHAQPLSTGDGSETAPVIAGDGSVAAIATDVRQPARPTLFGTAAALPLSGPVADYRAAQGYAAPETIVFTADDGTPVHGQLFRPPPGSAGRHAALVFVHGGPRRQMLPGFHPMGYYSNAYAMNQHLAAEGFVVLSVNYRGGTGYGRAFRKAADTASAGASEYRDVIAAGRWLSARGDVDPARIGIWGGSWGGYLASLAAARDSGIFAAAVDMQGDVDLTAPDDLDVSGLAPEARAAAQRTAWGASPLASIGGWHAPVLVIHGDDDRNVAFAQSAMLVRILDARGIDHEDLVLPDERHAFLLGRSWLAAYAAIDDFFRRRLR